MGERRVFSLLFSGKQLSQLENHKHWQTAWMPSSESRWCLNLRVPVNLGSILKWELVGQAALNTQNRVFLHDWSELYFWVHSPNLLSLMYFWTNERASESSPKFLIASDEHPLTFLALPSLSYLQWPSHSPSSSLFSTWMRGTLLALARAYRRA